MLMRKNNDIFLICLRTCLSHGTSNNSKKQKKNLFELSSLRVRVDCDAIFVALSNAASVVSDTK